MGVPCDDPWCIVPHCTGTPPPDMFKLDQLRPPQPYSPMLISGGYWSAYGRQTGSMHPTGIVGISGPMSFLGVVVISGTRSLQEGRNVWIVSMSKGVDMSRGGYPPPNMRPQGVPLETWYTMGYSQQAGSMHPTGMLSCYRPQCSCGKMMF